MADVTQTTPPGLDPAQISPQALATLFPQAPATPPIAPSPNATPGAGSMQDYANLAAEQQRQLLSSPPAQEAASERAAAQGFAKSAAETALPQMAPHIERGGGFLHNLGQVLQMISMATPEGRQIFGPSGPVYGPKIAEYRAKQAGLIGQKEAAEKAAEESGKEVSAEAGVAGRTIYGGSRVEAAQITAATAAQSIMQRHQDNLARIAGMKDMTQMRTAMEGEVAKIRSEAEIEAAKIGGDSRQNVADIMAASGQSLLNTKIAEDPSVAGAIKRWFGLGGAEAPGGAQPVAGAAPLPARTPKKSTPAKAGAEQYRRNPTTKKVERSTDGGKTWQ